MNLFEKELKTVKRGAHRSSKSPLNWSSAWIKERKTSCLSKYLSKTYRGKRDTKPKHNYKPKPEKKKKLVEEEYSQEVIDLWVLQMQQELENMKKMMEEKDKKIEELKKKRVDSAMESQTEFDPREMTQSLERPVKRRIIQTDRNSRSTLKPSSTSICLSSYNEFTTSWMDDMSERERCSSYSQLPTARKKYKKWNNTTES